MRKRNRKIRKPGKKKKEIGLKAFQRSHAKDFRYCKILPAHSKGRDFLSS
ncbi:hypothetical protein Aasi_1749 [Candidatus Amoebophilus asiaticus 5a2]|uniref:Uncharacterized protein n=1 Tax=Amoebophilus asiaticus (strain 5a2) TaxID=452471 RepID=C3L3Y5_AMOA5|nr:hypothetical protein Aasi_1749 [Candidatus Amoebophilus asiaticus 5a2]